MRVENRMKVPEKAENISPPERQATSLPSLGPVTQDMTRPVITRPRLCCWPIHRDGEKPRLCGKPIEDSVRRRRRAPVYCEEHDDLAYVQAIPPARPA